MDNIFYHGTKHDINSFIDDFVGDGNDQEGPGIYFGSTEDVARAYGNKVYKVKLNYKKPVSIKDGQNASDKELMWLIKNAPNWKENAQNWSENPEVGAKMALQAIKEYNDNPHQQFLQVWVDFYRYKPVQYVRNMVKLGYDVILIPMLNDVVHAVVLNPSIIEFIDKNDYSNEIISESLKNKFKRLSGII